MISSRRLPVELQTILLSYQPIRPTPLSSFLTPLSFRHQSTLAASFHVPTRPLSTFAENNRATPLNLFEPPTSEYNDVPLSVLDFPEAPRTPGSALVNLLREKKYDEATTLLRELRRVQDIPPKLEFLRQAYALLKDKNRVKKGVEWMEWWEVSPSLEDFYRASRNTVPRLDKLVDKMLRYLPVNYEDSDRAKVFGVSAAARGFYGVVAKRLLVHSAAYAPPEVGEEIWNACLLGYQHLAIKKRVDSDEPRTTVGRRDRIRTSASRFQHRRAKSDWMTLVATRAQMIRAHATIGRLDLAAQLLESTMRPLSPEVAPVRIGKKTHLHLMLQAAKCNRRDVFEKIYESFLGNKGRLVLRSESQGRFKLLTRAANTSEILSTAQAYSLFKRRSTIEPPSSVSPIEEVINSESRAYDEAIRLALETDDFKEASKALMACIKAQCTPSLDTAANFFIASRKHGSDLFSKQLANSIFSFNSTISPRTKVIWASALMLSHIRMDEHHHALKIFSTIFELESLPPRIRDAIGPRSRAFKKRIGMHYGLQGLIPDAHSFSLAVQALIPKLEKEGQVKVAGEGEEPTQTSMATISAIDEIYKELLGIRFPLIPRSSSLPSNVDSDSSPLDPHTFIPILAFYASLPSHPPSHQLQILEDMAKLGLRPTIFHWGVLVGAHAKKGNVEGAIWVLDQLEGSNSIPSSSTSISDLTTIKPLPLSLSPRLSASLTSLAAESSSAIINLKLYTSIIAGATMSGELIAANQVKKRYMQLVRESGVTGETVVDEKMLRAMSILGKRIQGTHGRAANGGEI